MPEHMPKFRAPSKDVEKSILPQGGIKVEVAQAFSDSEMSAQVKEAAEYKASVGNPLAPDTPAINQPAVISKIIEKAKSNTKGNYSPGQNGVRDNPWTASGMGVITSDKTGYYNPGGRAGMSTVQKTNKL